MKKTKFWLAVFVFSALLSGCASTGNQALKEESEQTVKTKIKEGETTKASVRSMFGSPVKTSFTDGGKEIWTYELSDVKGDAVNYIPIVNLFGSSYSGMKKELVVMFDGDKVSKYSMSESDVQTKSGMFK